MGRHLKIALRAVAGLVVFAALFFFTAAGPLGDRFLNGVTLANPPRAGVEAERLHRSLTVVDWHADTLLWNRDVAERHTVGHVDLPRLAEGGVAIQAFTIVTKVPRMAALDLNRSDSDDITILALAQHWPLKTWTSLLQRALLQTSRLLAAERRSSGALTVLRRRADLDLFLERRARDPRLVAGVLGIEGSHALEDQLANVDVLFDAGVRMMAPSHFFDNGLGGSAHGMEKGGLTPLGREFLQRVEAKGILLDLAHASPAVIEDVLAAATRPVVVSHTGVTGTCPNLRNLTDAQVRKIAARGGLIAIGFWETATCGTDAAAIAKAIKYVADLVGAQHVALGSDFDGTITAPFDVRGMPLVTEALLAVGMSERDVAKVMGENSVALLRASLPD